MIHNQGQLQELELTDLLEDVEKGWQVVLYNDDFNTFDWVIECLMEICEHNSIQAEQCSIIVHYKGKCSVKNGEMPRMQAIATALCDRGLSAVTEPVN